jgi:hypothetical protein
MKMLQTPEILNEDKCQIVLSFAGIHANDLEKLNKDRGQNMHNVIKFLPATQGSATERRQVSIEMYLRSREADSLQGPEVWVIKKDELEAIGILADFVQNRHAKNKHKELSKSFLGCQPGKVPIMEGTFTSIGRVRQSVNSFLRKAVTVGARGLFIVGITEELFELLDKEDSVICRKCDDTLPKDAHQADMASRKSVSDSWAAVFREDVWEFQKEDVPGSLRDAYIGNSPAAEFVRHMIIRAGNSDIPVLILGPSGTGKEVVARSIHEYSKRRMNQFIAFNCSAIPRDLLESELFGCQKGAYTGADANRVGLWQIAHEGTLFLDEIGDLHLDHQAKILRALQDKKVRRVGANQEESVSARIVAATNIDLYARVKEGKFREDLFYRLRCFQLPTPPLREHKEDIPLLAQSFWTKITGEFNSVLPNDIIDGLMACNWPGNVRELKMVLNQLHSFFPMKDICLRHLKAIFDYNGYIFGDSVENHTVSADIVNIHQAECLQHLRQVDEVIHAARVLLGPFKDGIVGKQDTVAQMYSFLGHHLAENEKLCRQPLLFHREELFAEVYHLQGKLVYLRGLFPSQADSQEKYTLKLSSAVQYWQKVVAGELEKVLISVFKEIETLLDAA